MVRTIREPIVAAPCAQGMALGLLKDPWTSKPGAGRLPEQRLAQRPQHGEANHPEKEPVVAAAFLRTLRSAHRASSACNLSDVTRVPSRAVNLGWRE